jgi:type IV fimbrial biogenesis protein FimT
MKRRTPPSGFTLLELMIVLAILGIMAGIGIPNLLSYIPKARLNGAARMVMVDLMAARMKAVKTNARTQVHFSGTDIGENQYRINNDVDNSGGVNNPEGDATLRDVQDLYSDVTLSSNNNPIFLPRGTATNLATITITNPSGSKTVTTSITGRVKIN